MGTTALPFLIGNRAPEFVGAAASGRFFSLDAQAGRPALIVALGAVEPEAAANLLRRLIAMQPELAVLGVDLVPLAPATMPFTARFATDPTVTDLLIYLTKEPEVALRHLDGAAVAVLIDRCARVVEVFALGEYTDISQALGSSIDRVSSSASTIRSATAPALIIPNVASPMLCRALIDHFEASPHEAGVMASFSDGYAHAKLDESKKKRRDMELTPDSLLHAEVVNLLGARIVPEIKRAFQADIVNADRILIARYDDTGGYFRRHRDNAAPHTAFREFALSLNLNTDEYVGGELMFPEFDNDRYSPPTGGAIVFSAALLHEAAPVTKGSRYVLLTFLGGTEAQARLAAWSESQNTKAS